MRWTSVLALVGVSLVWRAAHADDQPVLPATLEGDPALVAQVGEELTRRGVTATAGAGEDAVLASLAPEGDGIRVALRDPQGRSTDRLVASVDTAAALIESWSRRDIADPLLAPRAPVPQLPPPPPVVVEPAVVTPPPSQWMPVLRLGGESWNRSLWLAGSVGACARVGRLCLGGSMRLARQLGPRDGDFEGRFTPPGMQTDFETLAQAELPISLGRPTLVLGLGAGLGWRFDDVGFQAGVRAEAHAGLVLPLWSRLALDAGLTLAAAPATGERDPNFPQVRPTEGQLRVGFGLRWGLP